MQFFPQRKKKGSYVNPYILEDPPLGEPAIHVGGRREEGTEAIWRKPADSSTRGAQDEEELGEGLRRKGRKGRGR